MQAADFKYFINIPMTTDTQEMSLVKITWGFTNFKCIFIFLLIHIKVKGEIHLKYPLKFTSNTQSY